MKHSESLKNIAPAIHRTQNAISGAIKDANNPFFRSKYADLESCWDAVKPALQLNGLSVVQTLGFIPNAGPTLITTLLHISGEYITGEQPVCAKGENNPQEMGSAITYARRYGLSAIVGLIQVDDDAEGAMRPKQSKPLTVNDKLILDSICSLEIPSFPAPKLAGEAPACPQCAKKMMVSKYPGKVTGLIGWYCTPCKKSVPKTA